MNLKESIQKMSVKELKESVSNVRLTLDATEPKKDKTQYDYSLSFETDSDENRVKKLFASSSFKKKMAIVIQESLG